MLLTAILSQAVFYQKMEFLFRDFVHTLTAPVFHADDILLIDIDENSLAELEPLLGSWPYDRDIFALVTQFLVDSKVDTIVYDILFSERRLGDEEFSKAIKSAGNVSLASLVYDHYLSHDLQREQSAALESLSWKIESGIASTGLPKIIPPRPSFLQNAAIGVMNISPDQDGVLRRIPLFFDTEKGTFPSLALAALFPQPGGEPVRFLDAEQKIRIGERKWPVDEYGSVIIQFPKNIDAIAALSFATILRAATGREGGNLDESILRNKTVFIGSSALVLGDYAHSPIQGRMSGLSLLAIAFHNLNHNLTLIPQRFLLNSILILIAVFSPLLAFRKSSDSSTFIWIAAATAAGFAVVILCNIGMVNYFRQESVLLLPMVGGFCSFTMILMARVRNLYFERQNILLEKKAAEESNRLKSQFMAEISHDLRMPITSIKGYNEYLSSGVRSSQLEKENFAIIENNCNLLLTLIDNLLNQARLEAGQIELKIGPTSIPYLLTSAADTFGVIAAQKNIEIVNIVERNISGPLMIDALRTRQILLNIISNAIKFSEKGQIIVRADWQNQNLLISVKDSGCGIPEQSLSVIFEAFRQADNVITASHGGVGLGLAISRNLVQLMGGSISVDSKPNVGTTFEINIPAPIASPGSDRNDASTSKNSFNGPIKTGSVASVLIVDDSTDIINLAKLHLNQMGVQALSATNGREGIQKAYDEQPDLILMDINLPDMDGTLAVKMIREAGYYGKIVAFTADSEEEFSASDLKEKKLDGYLIKPFNREQLKNIFDQTLRI